MNVTAIDARYGFCHPVPGFLFFFPLSRGYATGCEGFALRICCCTTCLSSNAPLAGLLFTASLRFAVKFMPYGMSEIAQHPQRS